MTPRLLLLPLALCLLGPAAHATDPADTVLGADCGYNAAWVQASVADLSAGGEYEFHGLAYGYAVVSDPADPGRPIGASLRCEIRINGVPVSSTPTVHGTTVLAAAGLLTFTAAPTDALALCAVVDLDAGGTHEVCGVETSIQMPPQEIGDAIHGAVDLVVDAVNAVLCAVTGDDVVRSPVPFSAGAGTRSGVIFTADDGGDYDCP